MGLRQGARYETTRFRSVPLEVLHRPFVLLSSRTRPEGAEVAALAGPGVGLARVKAVFARRQFSDHGSDLRATTRTSHRRRGLHPRALQRRCPMTPPPATRAPPRAARREAFQVPRHTLPASWSLIGRLR